VQHQADVFDVLQEEKHSLRADPILAAVWATRIQILRGHAQNFRNQLFGMLEIAVIRRLWNLYAKFCLVFKRAQLDEACIGSADVQAEPGCKCSPQALEECPR
jgi:hypothetical protein